MMKFSWASFDPSFLKEIILSSDKAEKYRRRIERDEDDVDMLASMMLGICPYPDAKFVMNYHKIIEEKLLLHYEGEVRKICREANIKGSTYNERQANLLIKARNPSKTLINAYINAILNIAGSDIPMNEYSKFKYRIPVDMANTPIEDVPLYDYQKNAISALKKHFLENDKESGILVMPTGSGKSRTATTFLIREMVSQGYQILWIAHRHMLIDQAADCFYRFAGLAKINKPGIRDYNINCISGEHLSCSQVMKNKCEIIVASINSICRNKEHLQRILESKVMVVVDECHHTFAPTYQDVISFIRKKRKNSKLLGLTATPIRANERDSDGLLKLFGNNIVYSVPTSSLIAQGYLSNPNFITVKTGKNFEPDITENEAKLINRYGELPETLISKIADSEIRNRIILDEYLAHKETYGKTLIFALNVVHCRLLQKELEDKGVKCAAVFSGNDNNNTLINDFKDNKYDVLINVNIMSEGTDVPDINTVFLTRPTQSEGLLMQMIGRGMRGVNAGGTETVNIVDFHDTWDTFNKWLNPEWIISSQNQDILIQEKTKRKPVIYEEYEWKLCIEAYRSIVSQATDYNRNISIPVAWYSLIDEEGEVYRFIVFENQLKGLLSMLKDKKSWMENGIINGNYFLQKYFSYFCNQPTTRDLELLALNYINNEDAPERHTIENRKTIDPVYVVMNSENSGDDLFELAGNIFDSNAIAQDLYGTKEKYIEAVCKAKIYRNNPLVVGTQVEELPLELIPFDRTPCYDIQKLFDEVKNEMFDGVYEGISSISWTDVAYKKIYGRFTSPQNTIVINCVLNSKDVKPEVIKFVIYHEMLHRDNMSHDAAFKALEHKYPHYEECEAFLKGNMETFDIDEW